MADPRSPLIRHQVALLKSVQALGLCTDDSLAAYLRQHGVLCDRSTITAWRMGRRQAPLGLLAMVLGHVDDPAEVLGAIASNYALRVVPDMDTPATVVEFERLAMRVAAETGDVQRVVLDATADGVVTAEEAERIHVEAAELRQKAAELDALAMRGRR